MKYAIWAFFGIAAAIIITLLCVGCTEKITEESENMTMFVDVNMHQQVEADDPCVGTITMWLPDKSKIASAFRIKWWGFEWRTFPTYSSSHVYDQVFAAGTQNIEVSAEAWDEKGRVIGEYHDTGKHIGCFGEDPGDEEIKLGGMVCFDPNEPAAPTPCDCVTLVWSGGNAPYDILWGYDSEILFLMDSCNCNKYGAKTLGDPTYYQIEDSSGSVSNVLRWDYPDDCQ